MIKPVERIGIDITGHNLTVIGNTVERLDIIWCEPTSLAPGVNPVEIRVNANNNGHLSLGSWQILEGEIRTLDGKKPNKDLPIIPILEAVDSHLKTHPDELKSFLIIF